MFSALAGVGLSRDPEARKRYVGAHRLLALGLAINFVSRFPVEKLLLIFADLKIKMLISFNLKTVEKF